MLLSDVLEFRKDLYFEGAVQADWFYSKDKSKMVAENFVFHGSEYYGVVDVTKKRIDTISFVKEIAGKIGDETSNPLNLAIADYGTGKSHLAVTLALLLSGPNYIPETFNKIIHNISLIDNDSAKTIEKLCNSSNLVIVLNGMKDFNLHSEILKSAQKSLSLFGISDKKLKRINTSLSTAELFFTRNFSSLVHEFENEAAKKGVYFNDNELFEYISGNLLTDENVFEIIDSVYEKVNGMHIRWDEGLSAGKVIDALVSEYCGLNGSFDNVIILFDEFGRYLEYASDAGGGKSGDSALQQIFEACQNYGGVVQVINFIQSDIKTYLQRVDNTRNISRYIGRYDVSDKYYLSSNLETVFANLIQRKDKVKFDEYVVDTLRKKQSEWDFVFQSLNKWVNTSGIWADASLFNKVIVEGIYPLHPLSTFILTQLSDYLQNRSSLTLVSQMIDSVSNQEIDSSLVMVYPEELMKGDLFTEMLSAEQEGKQSTEHCIRYNNILRKYSDKLSVRELVVLRSNLVIRILRLKTVSYDEVLGALQICSNLTKDEIQNSLDFLVNEYGILGYDDRANCFDFMEESNGAHDYKIKKRRYFAQTNTRKDSLIRELFLNQEILEYADILSNVNTNFGNIHHILTKEWEFEQKLLILSDFTMSYVKQCIFEWENSIDSIQPKGKLIWLYNNSESTKDELEKAMDLALNFKNMPIVVMLLNDVEKRLFNDLVEYDLLKKLPDDIKNKYERHYFNDVELNKNNVSTEFNNLKKARLFLKDGSVQKLEKRLSPALTDVFDQIYPYAVSFNFDAFVTTKYNKSKKESKTYCSILKLLLSGNVSSSSIHSWPSDTRNRVAALLSFSSGTSWKCINQSYHVIPPEDENAARVYSMLQNALREEGASISCNEILIKLSKPPYGMCEDSIMLMIAVFLSNLSYCLRLLYKGHLMSVPNWRDELVFKDDKASIDVLKQSVIVSVNLREVEAIFNRLLQTIMDNTNVAKVSTLEKQLDDLIQENEIPEVLESKVDLAKKKINDGKNAKSEWTKNLELVRQKSNDATAKNLYVAFQALEMLQQIDFCQIFTKFSYSISDENKEALFDLKADIQDYIEQNIEFYIDSMVCNDVSAIKTYKNHIQKNVQLFNSTGYSQYAQKLKVKSEHELESIERIQSKFQLKSDVDFFANRCTPNSNTSFVQVTEWRKDLHKLQERYDEFSSDLGSDRQKIQDKLLKLTKKLDEAFKRTYNLLSSIYDRIYELKTVDDVLALEVDVQDCIRRGLREEDKEEMLSILKELKALKDDINDLSNSQEDLQKLSKIKTDLIQKYENSENITEKLICSIVETFENKAKQKEKLWVDIYLNNDEENDIAMLYKWENETKILPKYLSSTSIEKYENKKRKIEHILQEKRIQTAVQYFLDLSNDEKQEFIKSISSYLY